MAVILGLEKEGQKATISFFQCLKIMLYIQVSMHYSSILALSGEWLPALFVRCSKLYYIFIYGPGGLYNHCPTVVLAFTSRPALVSLFDSLRLINY